MGRRNDDRGEPNFQKVRASRKALVPGDIFRMKLPDQTYVFGRVGLVDVPYAQAPMPKCNLVNVYRGRSADGQFDVANQWSPAEWCTEPGGRIAEAVATVIG